MQMAQARPFSTEDASWICDRAVQLCGGLGVKRGSAVEHLWRDVRALRIYEGFSEIQKLILLRARSSVERAGDPAGDSRMAKFERHVLVCTNEREPGDARGCCKAPRRGRRGGGLQEAALRARLQARRAPQQGRVPRSMRARRRGGRCTPSKCGTAG